MEGTVHKSVLLANYGEDSFLFREVVLLISSNIFNVNAVAKEFPEQSDRYGTQEIEHHQLIWGVYGQENFAHRDWPKMEVEKD